MAARGHASRKKSPRRTLGIRESTLENLVMFGGVYKGRRVFVTGQTGFKGSWLSHWLLSLGAEVRGFALAPQADQPLHDWLELGNRMHSQYADIRDRDAVNKAVKEFKPEIIFHLAAQLRKV